MNRSPIFIVVFCGLLFSSFANRCWADDDIFTTAATNGSTNRLVALVVAAGLDEALKSDGSFTVFAPSDEAFAKLPKSTLDSILKPENREQLASILKYHVLGQEVQIGKRRPSHPITKAKTLLGENINFKRTGSKVTVNGANVVVRNVKCKNGLIHIIDSVLLPPVEDKSIVGVAAKSGEFKTLLAAAKAAGLVETLQSKGPLTIFAPTDAAFKKLPKGTLKSLLKPENKSQLEAILKYHVIAGKIAAKDAIAATTAKTLGGQAVKATIRNGRLSINEASVTANDIEAENGIIHVIDSVLLPPSEEHDKVSATPRDEITITANWNSPVARDGLVANRVNIRCTAGSSVQLTNLNANEVITSVSGGGAVSIQGSTNRHEVRVSGGGVLRATELVTNETVIKVNGGGVATVNAKELLDASAFAGSSLKYVETGALIKKNINKWATFGPLSSLHKSAAKAELSMLQLCSCFAF